MLLGAPRHFDTRIGLSSLPKPERLNRMIFFGERSLRQATLEFAAHFHTERNHQGLNNRLIEPDGGEGLTSAAIECVQ